MSSRTAENVARHGWHATVVLESEENSGFLYTTGLGPTFGHPELIIFGLPGKAAYAVAADLIAHIREGKAFNGIATCTLLELTFDMRSVHETQVGMYFADTVEFHRVARVEKEIEALQLFWPDDAGRSRFDPACDTAAIVAQPRLDLPLPPSEWQAFLARYGSD
jgi:hypothetical protein